MHPLLTTTGLYVLTAVAEIVGCYLPWLWLNQRAPVWVLLPERVSVPGPLATKFPVPLMMPDSF